MQFWLHPIVGYPATSTPQGVLRVAELAGYEKLVMAPLNHWDASAIRQVSPDKVGAIEGAWHPLTVDDSWQRDAWLRVLGKRTAEEAALPWDNFFWGAAADVRERMQVIRELFPHAIYSGHSPTNTVNWVGPYAWEINPDHGVETEEGIFKVPGLISVDFVHLLRGPRNNPDKNLVAFDRLLPFLTELVRQRRVDIAMVHLHLKATQIIPFTLGIVPPYLQQALKLVALADKGNLPVAVQFFPLVPLNLTERSAALLLRSVRTVAESAIAEYRRSGQLGLGFGSI